METHSLWKYSLTRSPDKAMVHFIPVTLGDTLNLEFGNEVLKFIYDAIIASLRAEGRDLRRGDIIQDVNQDYRNYGKYFFDGVKIILPYMEIDDYGSIPPSFEAVTEFPVHYWYGIVDHNEYIWLNPHILSYLKTAPVQVGIIHPEWKNMMAFVTFDYARPDQPIITYTLADVPAEIGTREELIAEFSRKINKHTGPFDYMSQDVPQAPEFKELYQRYPNLIVFPNTIDI